MSDLIDRQTLIESLYGSFVDAQEWVWSTNDPDIKPRAESAVATFMEAILRVKQMPSVPQWIPCSERLPEEDKEVLISYRYQDGEGDTSNSYIDITSYGDAYFGGRKCSFKEWRQPFEYFHANYEVIAWMPLPDPWKGDNDD